MDKRDGRKKCERKKADRSFENVAKSKYLEKKLTNPNFIYDKIKSRLYSHCLLPFSSEFFCLYRLPSKKEEVKIYKTVILPVYEICSLKFKKEYRLKIFETRLLRKYFERRGMK
jgi:hypothetical protein